MQQQTYQTWMDSTVYTRQDVFILETMGRDAGWLAPSACVSVSLIWSFFRSTIR
ncbi:hypothetical protein MGH68_13475 [Erysipelothrix sp. D19-032]